MISDMKFTPESRGISSVSLLNLLKKIELKKIPMHSLLIAKGEDILLNAYWSPFKKNDLHRMNSVTKSFVGLAIGALIEEKKLNYTDKIIDFFPETENYNVCDEIKEQTIYDLLTMRTSYVLVPGRHWVKYKLYDRIKAYFENKAFKPRQTLFCYDSPGSYILGVIVERITGKGFLDYLKSKALSKIGFSEGSTCIIDARGYSWGDSGLLCTTEDLYRTGILINKKGVWNGECLLNEEYLAAATSFIGSNCDDGNDANPDSFGYGYQIWKEPEGGFGFHGMGMQYLICIPEKDIYMACTADTQGNNAARAIFLDMFFDFVREEISENPLADDPAAYNDLIEYTSKLKLTSLEGAPDSDIASKVNEKRISLEDNPMNIKWLKIVFNGRGGSLVYENEQGEKSLPFGILENVITEFPEDGYDNLKIGESPKNYHHPCAVSAAWQDKTTFALKAQMIGNHLGSLYVRLGFNGNRVGVQMSKTTECFLNEYSGYAIGLMEK